MIEILWPSNLKSKSVRSFGSHNITISCCFTTGCMNLIYYLVPSPIPFPTLSLLHTKEKKNIFRDKNFCLAPFIRTRENRSPLVKKCKHFSSKRKRFCKSSPALVTFGFWSCLRFNCSRFATTLKADFKCFLLVQTKDIEMWICGDNLVTDDCI